MPTPSSHHHKLQDFLKTIRITRNADHKQAAGLDPKLRIPSR
jgi:hypothetical protein